MNITKKQVKALLDVINSDETRPILTNAKIDTFEGNPVLVATDTYKMSIIKLSDDVLPIMGQLIPRAELIKWYKLAGNKDYFTEADLLTIAKPDNGGFNDEPQYPKWQQLVPQQKLIQPQASIRINAAYMHTMQVLADCDTYPAGMLWEFYGDLAPVVARHENNIYIVMPLKKH